MFEFTIKGKGNGTIEKPRDLYLNSESRNLPDKEVS